MASRPFDAFPVIKNGDMSGNLTSLVSIVTNLSLLSYSLVWSGSTPVGTAKVQVSNDYSLNADGSVRNAGNWSDFPGASASVSGNSGTGYFNVSDVGSYAVRLVYTFTSGTGTLQAFVNSKVQ